MPITQDEFRAALSKFASGVTVVTTKDSKGNLHGITVSAFCSVSLKPPLILICIEKNAGSHNAFDESKLFIINVLREEQMHHSNHFASPLEDKFEGVEIEEGAEGIPVLKDTLATLECKLVETCEGGDHTIFIGQIEKAIINEGKPLIYFHGDYRSIDDLYKVK
jgi:flavin reductase (DIM6/NTAB) family NADH-FMN oxidoreductase RutF